MSSSGVLGQEYAFFGGGRLANAGSSVLPPQAIPKRNKNEKWIKANLDNLEREGLNQYMENLEMIDYYRMIDGDVAYMDITDGDKDLLLKYVQDVKDKLHIPSQLKHYDLLFPLLSKLTGEWALSNTDLRFDTTDDVSANDYIRERTFRLAEYTKALFDRELRKAMIVNGLDVDTQFKSEEEQQAYEAKQEQILRDYFPEKIDSDMKRNFKTEAAQWAEKTWERDYERFRMNILENSEIKDILMTGKSARHYRIGYDYYYPEHWHPVEVFHSKEDSVTRLEDCEFAGRIKWYSLTDLMTTYGHLLSEKQRKGIYKYYFGENYYESFETSGSHTTGQGVAPLLGHNTAIKRDVGIQGYSDNKLAVEWEQATGIPQSETTNLITGETKPSFTTPLDGPDPRTAHGKLLAQALRNDFTIRTDTVQTTEVYFKGSKKIGLMTYRTESGYLNTIEVDEDILPEVLKEKKISVKRNISLTEYNLLKDDDKENTLVWVDVPVVYRGVKINVQSFDLEDIYILEELPFQIRGEKGNIFDVKLPVCGYIGSSFFKKIRPYQSVYNYLNNQVTNYLQKEVGAFFVIDVNTIPTEFFENSDESTEGALIEVRNLAKKTGLLPTDMSRNSLAQNGGGLAFNPMVYNEAHFTNPIRRNIELMDVFKWKAYETLGITPQAMGTPSEYSTVEGIEVGQKAQMAQSQNIDEIFMENKRAGAIIHMAVAQYCQLNNNDVNYVYMASDNELNFLSTIKDEDFDLRQIDVRSTYDRRKNHQFQQLKTALIQNNTMGNDALALFEIVMSDDYLELKDAVRRAREYGEKMQLQQQQANAEEAQKERDYDYKKHTEKLQVDRERIEATKFSATVRGAGQAAPSNDDNIAQEILAKGDQDIKRQKVNNQFQIEREKIEADLKKHSLAVNNKLEELLLKREENALKREDLRTKKYVAELKHKDSIINKN